MEFTKDKLKVKVFDTREKMGQVAGEDVAACIKALLAKKEYINMIFAAAPSQNDFLEALIVDKAIEWGRINAFHMDEYIGLEKDAPQSFGTFLKDQIFDKVPFRSVNYINGQAKHQFVEMQIIRLKKREFYILCVIRLFCLILIFHQYIRLSCRAYNAYF